VIGSSRSRGRRTRDGEHGPPTGMLTKKIHPKRVTVRMRRQHAGRSTAPPSAQIPAPCCARLHLDVVVMIDSVAGEPRAAADPCTVEPAMSTASSPPARNE